MKESENRTGYLQLTRKCNNRCIFCSHPYIDISLSLDELERNIKYFKNNMINSVAITGGEPTLNTYLPNIIRIFNKNRLKVFLITNGIRFSEERYCTDLKKIGLDKVHITFHSHIKRISNQITLNKASFDMTLKGIENCIKYICVPTINLVINKLNYKQLPDTVLFLNKKFPEIVHYSINFIDVVGKARINTSTVPSYSESELYISKLMLYLTRLGKSFRLERVPLCYMAGFEHFSTEAIKIFNKEKKNMLLITKKRSEGEPHFINEPLEEGYFQPKVCGYCTFKKICPGISVNYSNLYGFGELYPEFGCNKSADVLSKIKNL